MPSRDEWHDSMEEASDSVGVRGVRAFMPDIPGVRGGKVGSTRCMMRCGAETRFGVDGQEKE